MIEINTGFWITYILMVFVLGTFVGCYTLAVLDMTVSVHRNHPKTEKAPRHQKTQAPDNTPLAEPANVQYTNGNQSKRTN